MHTSKGLDWRTCELPAKEGRVGEMGLEIEGERGGLQPRLVARGKRKLTTKEPYSTQPRKGGVSRDCSLEEKGIGGWCVIMG